jgi:hypothetical protein
MTCSMVVVDSSDRVPCPTGSLELERPLEFSEPKLCVTISTSHWLGLPMAEGM